LSDEIGELLASKKNLYDIHQDEVVKWAKRVKDKWMLEGMLILSIFI
jgi:hypothetical protein